MNRVNNVISINTSLEGDFFKYWFRFLKPFHNLTNKEMDVIATFMRYRFELTKAINDDSLLDKVTLSDEYRKKVREDCV